MLNILLSTVEPTYCPPSTCPVPNYWGMVVICGLLFIIVMAFTPYKSDGVPRSRLIYILLGIFTGVIGIHSFYAGYKKRGMLQVFLFITFLGIIISAILALVDIVTTTEDAKGVRFKE